MLIAIYLPARIKTKRAAENSGYLDKFSNSLKVLKEIKRERVTHSEVRDSKNAKVAENISSTANVFPVRRVARTQPNSQLANPSSAKWRKVHGSNATSAQITQKLQVQKSYSQVQGKIYTFDPKQVSHKYKFDSLLARQLNETAALVHKLDEEYEYVSNSTARYKSKRASTNRR